MSGKDWITVPDLDAPVTQQVIEEFTQPSTSCQITDTTTPTKDEQITTDSTGTQSGQDGCRPESPILKPFHLRKLIFPNAASVNEFTIEECTPTPRVHDAEQQHIIDSLSPARKCARSQVQSSSSHLLDSQLFTYKSNSSSSTSCSFNNFTSTSGSSSPKDMQHAGRKNTKYKRGSFAYKAMQAIKEQRCHSDLWQHENITKRVSIDEHNIAAGDAKNLNVCDVICEFNRDILVCMGTSGERCLVLLPPPPPPANESGSAVNTFKGKWIRLFPPYSRKFIDYQGSTLSFYYNVYRFISELTIASKV